jgi:hypothetical protein
MRGYRVTFRRGPEVQREDFDRLDDAIAHLHRGTEEAVGSGPMPAVKMLREFDSSERVAARLEISTGGWLRGKTAGVDVMGDGSVIPFRGGIARNRLELRRGESALDAVRRYLSA